MPRVLSTDPMAGLQSLRVLSTDPNAGLPDTTRVLSTDPQAGIQTEDPNEGLTGKAMDMFQRIGGTLGRPGAVVAGGIDAYQKGQGLSGMLENVKDALTPTGVGTWKETITGDDLLANQGYQQGTGRAVAGFGIDLVTDPLNLIPAIGGAKVAKALGSYGSKVDAVGRGISRAADHIPGIKAAKEVLITRPGLNEVMSNAGDISYRDIARLGDSSARAAGEGAEAYAETFFKGIEKPERQVLAHAIDTGTTASLPAHLQPLAQQWTKKMDELHEAQVALGNLEPGQKVQNYVQYLTKGGRDVEAVVGSPVSTIPQSARKREKFQTLADAVKHGGATDDALEILAQSVAQVDRSQARAGFLKDVYQQFGKAPGTPGSRRLRTEHLNISKYGKDSLADLHVDARIADDLERAILLWQKPTEMDNVMKTGVKVFKALATSVNPAHHPTNFIGNVHNMYVAGMTMPEITKGLIDAYKIVNGKHLPAAVGKYSGEDVLKLAKKYEVLGTATQLGELTGEGTHKILNNALFRKTRQVGTEVVEEPARLALFMDQLKKGKTAEQAAIKVKDVLFDYTELTDAEKKIRDYGVVPFYTWMRKNIPLQLEMSIKNPHKVEAVGDFVDVFENRADNQAMVPPEGLTRQGYVPSLLDQQDGLPAMMRLALPGFDVNKLGHAGTLTDSFGPHVKMAIENPWFGTGRSLFAGAPIQTPTGMAKASSLASILGILTPDSSLDGIITPKDVGGRSMQNDIAAWMMNQIPTTFLGSTARSEDPLNPGLGDIKDTGISADAVLGGLGLTSNVITPEDQLREIERRMGSRKREALQRIILEQ